MTDTSWLGPPIDVRPLFAGQQAAFIAMLRGLQPGHWAQPTVCPGWDVKDIAAHVLGDHVGRLSRHRDGYSPLRPRDGEPFPAFLDRINAEWVTAARRLSPRLLIEQLFVAADQIAEFWSAVDPDALGDGVSWAGATSAPVWLDAARDFSEYWTHHQQIGDAIGQPGTVQEYLGPVLDRVNHLVPAGIRYLSVETATQTLHRLTSYAPGRDWDVAVDDPRIVQDLEANDMARLPWFVKRYPQPLPRLPLPRELPGTTEPAVAVLAGLAEVKPAPLDLPNLSRLLYLSAGVVRTMDRDYGIHPFRAAGSAGGRFPLELYVAVPPGGPLPAGVHWYDPLDHALVQVGPPPLIPLPGAGGPAVVVTGIPWRTGWRYRERGYRHVYWDAGTMLAQLLALADSAGLAAGLHARFPDAEVAALVGADRVHEFPVAVVSLGEAEPCLRAHGPAAAGEVDRAPVEFPLVTAAQRAGEGGRLGPPWDRGEAVDVPLLASAPVESVIAARGSQRRMDASRGLSQDLLRTCMSVALRGLGLPHWVVVHDVAGLAPGVYRWPSLTAPVRAAALRDELYRVCLDQALGRDAAFVAIAATGVGRLGDAEYREAHLAAGLAEGRLHLAAYALGASASGMTFLDSEVPALLGEPLDGLLFTCVGVPRYPNAPAGPPGAPSRVRRVTPAS